MADNWDVMIKVLIGSNPQDFVSLLLPGARFRETLDKELHAHTIKADILMLVDWHEHDTILHVEFQRRRDGDISKRMWEYNAMTTIQHQRPTASFVLYLIPDGNVPDPFYEVSLWNGRRIHDFSYDILKLWELPVEELKQPGREGMLPLMPLAKGGMSYRRVDEMIERLQETEREDLYAMAYSLAALAFKKTEDKAWLKRRFNMLKDILEESWAYQEMVEEAQKKGMEKGLEKGMEKGLEEGIEKGVEKGLNAMRQTVLHLVQRKYPQLDPLATQYVNQVKEPEQLSSLIDRLFDAQSSEEVAQLFTQQ